MHDVRHLGDVFLEHADGVGIGDHDPGDIFGDGARQGFGIHHAARVGRDVFDRVAGHVRGGGVGAVGGIRNQKLLARVALSGERGVNQQNAGELAMRAGGGLQSDRVHAGDFEQAALQLGAHLHRALRERVGLIGMNPRHAVDARGLFVDARVVLHGAGAQRIQAQVDGVIPGGEAREVADDVHFADFREVFDLGARVPCP